MILYSYKGKSYLSMRENNLYIRYQGFINMAKNTIIDGIAASEHLDSSGESLSIQGMDISSLGGPDSILNWEHGSKDRPSQVVGKVTFAKKIMKESDAKTKREKYFWNKAKKPMVYIKAELFDGIGHSGAQDVAAMLRYNNKDKGEDSRLVVGFSIEGGKMEKKGMIVTKSIARDVAITVKPCNKVCDAELIEDDVDEDFLYKNQEFDCEIMQKGEYLEKSRTYRSMIIKDLKKALPSKDDFKGQMDKLKDTKSFKQKQDVSEKIATAASKPLSQPTGAKPKREFTQDTAPKNLKIGDKIKYNRPKMKTGKDIYNDPDTWKSEKNNMRKALIAGMMGGTPDSKTGSDALAGEDLDSTLQKPFRSKAQRRFAYANEEKFGGKKGIKEWEEKTPKSIPEKVKKNEGDMGEMEDNHTYLTHYSPQVGLKSINPNFQGSGVDKRTKGRSLENKISFYYPHNYESPETLVTGQSKSKYTVRVPKEQKIYSSKEHGPDMIRMAKEKNDGVFSMDHFINVLKENGYHGFKSSPSGIDMVAMFHELPVHSEESSVKKSEKLEKMSQPVFSNKEIGSNVDLRSDVKMVDPEKTYKMKSGKEISQPELENKKIQNKYVQGEKQVSGAQTLDDFTKKGRQEVEEYKQKFSSSLDPQKQEGVNVQDPDYNINEAFEFKQKQKEGEQPNTNYPSVRHHEATHKFFSSVTKKMGQDVSNSLMNHIFENFFDKNDLEAVNKNLSRYYDTDNPHFKEEGLTHILDLIQDKKMRQSFNDKHSHMRSGKYPPRQAEQMDRDRIKRLKKGYQNAVKFVNSLNQKSLQQLHKQRTRKG